ncbi:unnamed protein product [Calypogeia fissa]
MKEPTQGTFAACKPVEYSQGFILKSFNVEGAGELRFPRSTEDALKLRTVCEEVPVRNGLDITGNTGVGHWQVDACKVTFPRTRNFLSTVQSLAVVAVRGLGLDGERVQLEVRVKKLFLYETGGPVTFHRDTQKEERIFATLMLQLPTEGGYAGVELLVKHGDEEKELNCHNKSKIWFWYTISFADCLLELRKIASGTKLCLA